MVPITFLHNRLNELLGIEIVGCNTSGAVWYPENTDTIIESLGYIIAEAWDTITLTVSNTSPALNEEITITPDNEMINFDFVVWQDGVEIDSGTVNDGVLELTWVEPGAYIVEIRNPEDETNGYVEIEVLE